MRQQYGLIGKKLTHSWSKKYFNDRFKCDGFNASYVNLEFEDVRDIEKRTLLRFSGLNVTVPYKEKIISFLDDLSPEAEKIGAVNCILVEDGRLIGYNTDAYGFRNSLRPYLRSWHNKALILGTGGASKAIAYVLEGLGLEYRYVSRNPEVGQFSYSELNQMAMEIFPFIINCTPLGMHPETTTSPEIPYEYLNKKNLLYDLVYNPEQTVFLQRGLERGAQAINGSQMLIYQAEASWRIWNGGSVEPAIDHDT